MLDATAVLGALLPGVVAALLALAATWLAARAGASKAEGAEAKPDEPARTSLASGSVAAGAGACAGLVVLLGGWPGLPPAQRLGVDGWLPPLALAAGLLGAVEALLAGLRPAAGLAARAALRAPLAVGLAVLLLRPRFEVDAGAGSVAVVALAALVLGAHLDLLLARRGPIAGALVPLVLGTGVAVALVCAKSARVGQLAGVVPSALGGLAAAAALARLAGAPAAGLARGAVPVAALLLVACGVRGKVYAELTGTSALLLLLAPAGAWLAVPLARRPRLAEAVGLLAVLLAAGVAAALSFPVHEPSPDGW